MRKFLKKEDLQLVNGGYVSDKQQNPVYNKQFYEAQLHADYVVNFAKLAKGKNFTGIAPDSIEKVREEVSALLQNNKTINFVKKQEVTEMPLTLQLKSEALNFIKSEESNAKVKQINNYLNEIIKISPSLKLSRSFQLCKKDLVSSYRILEDEFSDALESLNEIN